MPMEAMNRKYIVWITVIYGEYVKAQDAIEQDDTVSFVSNGKTVKSYLKSKIQEYHEVTNTK